MNRKQFLESLDYLNSHLGDYGFKKGNYIVLAGGAMVLHDPYVEKLLGKSLRKTTNDVDLSADPAVFQKFKTALDDAVRKRTPEDAKCREALKKLGATFHPSGYKQHERVLIKGVHGDFEISAGGRSIIGRPPVNVEGHLAQSIRDIHAFKSKLNRPKDQADLKVLSDAIEREKLTNPAVQFVRKDVEFFKKKPVRGTAGSKERF